MKTIIRKNGQKFNVTDALYEAIAVYQMTPEERKKYLYDKSPWKKIDKYLRDNGIELTKQQEMVLTNEIATNNFNIDASDLAVKKYLEKIFPELKNQTKEKMKTRRLDIQKIKDIWNNEDLTTLEKQNKIGEIIFNSGKNPYGIAESVIKKYIENWFKNKKTKINSEDANMMAKGFIDSDHNFSYTYLYGYWDKDNLPKLPKNFKKILNDYIYSWVSSSNNKLNSDIYNYIYNYYRANSEKLTNKKIEELAKIKTHDFITTTSLNLTGSSLTNEIKAAIDDFLKTTPTSKESKNIKENLPSAVITYIPDMIKKLSSGLENVQKSALKQIQKILINQYGREKATKLLNSNNFNLADDIIDGIVPEEKWDKISVYISNEIVKNSSQLVNDIYSSISGSADYVNYDNDNALYIQSDTLKKFIQYAEDHMGKNSFEKYHEIEMDKFKIIESFIAKYFYEYISNILLSDNFINDTIAKTDNLPEKWIKTFLNNLDRSIYLILMNEKGSTEFEKDEGADPIPMSNLTNVEVNKMWEEISEEILKEKPINPLDDVILNNFRIIINYINDINNFFSGKMNSYPSGDFKEPNNSRDNVSVNNKKQFFKIYNSYRKKLYDRTVNYVEELSFNKNYVQELKNNFSSIQSNEDNAIKSKDTIKPVINKCRILFGIDKNNNVSESIKETATLLEKKNNDEDNSVELVNTMTNMLDVLFKYVDDITERIDTRVKKNDSEELQLNVNIQDFYKFFDDSYVQNAYLYMTLLEKSIPLVKDTLNIDDETDPTEGETELETFRTFMGRLPNSSDYTLYEDTIRQLKEMNDNMKKIISKFKTLLSSNNYVQIVEYILKEQTEISWQILNNIFGSNLLTEQSADFIKRCFAYSALTRYVKDDPNANQLSKDIIGNGDGISENDLAKLFYNFIIVDTNISSQTFITLLMSDKSVNDKVSFNRTYLPNKFYTSQPVVLTSTDTKDFIGCITFVKYDFLYKMFKATGNFANSIKSTLKSFTRDSKV